MWDFLQVLDLSQPNAQVVRSQAVFLIVVAILISIALFGGAWGTFSSWVNAHTFVSRHATAGAPQMAASSAMPTSGLTLTGAGGYINGSANSMSDAVALYGSSSSPRVSAGQGLNGFRSSRFAAGGHVSASQALGIAQGLQ